MLSASTIGIPHFLSRNVTEFKCKKCLMNELNMSKEDWDKKVQDFKNQGCNLF